PARSRRKDDSGFGHQPPAELFAELLPHDRPLEDRRASFVHARASRDGISARSASSARNWIPRTVPSRLPTRSAISWVLYPSTKRRTMTSCWIGVSFARPPRTATLAERASDDASCAT